MGMKRKNGTGCVTKLAGNRRNPWYAKAPTTYNLETLRANPPHILSDEKGQKYFPDRTIPDLLLAQYNRQKGNINIDKSDYTFKQVYDEFSSRYFPTKEEIQLERETHQKTKGKLGKSITNNLKAAYKKCGPIYNNLYKSLRKEDFENIILSTTGCGTVINSLANLFRKLDNYAIEQDIIIKGYANLIKITNDMYTPTKKEGIPYSYEEINTIWQYEGRIEADITLFTIYTGARIEELLFTKTADVHINERYFVSGLKTIAGKRRIIPIHSDIFHIVNRYFNPSNQYLFTLNGHRIYYDNQFLPLYRQLMNELNMSHNTHDGRKTLHSELDRLGANKVCIDRIFGHKSGNIGDDAYTKKSIEELKETIEMVDYKNKKNTKITYLCV